LKLIVKIWQFKTPCKDDICELADLSSKYHKRWYYSCSTSP